jgi:hypothetical protein
MFAICTPTKLESSAGLAQGSCRPGLFAAYLRGARLAFGVLVLATLATYFPHTAAGQIAAIEVAQIDNSSGGAALDGFVTNDVTISFDGRYTGSQLLVLLDQGSIYQDPAGGIATPDFATASVEFDTFVAQGLPTVGTIDFDQSDGDIFGAVNLGGDHPGTFNVLLLNIAWHPSPPEFLEDLSDLLTARITLSDNASGTWSYLASAQGEITIEDRIIQGGVVQNGALLVPGAVPEPGTLGLTIASIGLLFCRMRERRRTLGRNRMGW